MLKNLMKKFASQNEDVQTEHEVYIPKRTRIGNKVALVNETYGTRVEGTLYATEQIPEHGTYTKGDNEIYQYLFGVYSTHTIVRRDGTRYRNEGRLVPVQ